MNTPTPDPIAARNEQFALLDPVEQRKTLGREVLARLAVNQLLAKEGTYLRVRKGHDLLSGDLQTLLASSETQCTCCALGAGVCALAGLEDRVCVFDGGGFGGRNALRLREVLGDTLNDLLESTFEGWDGTSTPARRFYYAYPDPTDRLSAIYAQLADTGTFNPSLDPLVSATP